MISKDIILYKRLLSHVLPYWKRFLLSIVSMIVLAATDPAIPALMQPMLDGAFVEKDPDVIAIIPILFILLFAVRGMASYISGISLHWVANKVIMDLRQAMFEQLVNYPTVFFDNNRSGNLMSRFTYDVTQIKEASTNALSTLVRDTLSVIGLLGWMFYIDWALATICLAGAPLIGIVISIIRKRLRKMSSNVQKTMADIHHVLGECFDAQKVIKLYGGQKVEKERFFETANAHRHFSMKFAMAATASSPAVQMITAIILAVIIYVGIELATSGDLTVGDFVSFFAAIAMLLGPLKRLASINEHIQKGLAACESVFTLLDMQIESQHGNKELSNPKGKIDFRDVSYRYAGSDLDALKSITLTINSGETVALVGESGSGKTTLANLLPKFYEPKEGKIFYDDFDISELTLNSLRKNIAYVSQDVVLFNDTVRNNIAYGELKDASIDHISEAAEAACATEFINKMPKGMDTIIGEDGSHLSGGQRQRLAIARALLKNARLLILDEATSSLDSHSEHHIQTAFENVRKGRTCLIIAHRLSTIENADRIIVLDNGRIVEEGAHEGLLEKNNYYSKLYKLQFYDQKK